MNTVTIKSALIAVMLSGATLFGQTPPTKINPGGSGSSSGTTGTGGSGGSGTTATWTAKAKPAPGSLAEQLETALKFNPDIKFAEAKVRESEAELQRTRQHVLGRVSALYAEVQAHKASLKILQEVLKMHEKVHETGSVPIAAVTTARSNVAKVQIELAKVEGELQSLVGSQGPGQASSGTTSGIVIGRETMAFSPDGKLYSLQTDGAIRIWDAATGKQVVAGYYPPAEAYVIVRATSVQQPMADRVRKMLDTSVKISEFQNNKELKEALAISG